MIIARIFFFFGGKQKLNNVHKITLNIANSKNKNVFNRYGNIHLSLFISPSGSKYGYKKKGGLKLSLGEHQQLCLLLVNGQLLIFKMPQNGDKSPGE